MAVKKSRPKSVNIRTYNVGFGDCFLLTFDYGSSKRHVLIDFGSTALPKPGFSLDRVAQNITQVTDGKLDAVVVTHRHADHISGFKPRKGKGSGDVIRKLARHAVIVQPWTEDPRAAPKAKAPPSRNPTSGKALAMAQTRSMAAMQEVAKIIADRAGRIDVSETDIESEDGEAVTKASESALGISQKRTDTLRFLGQTSLKNSEAIKNLMRMSTRKKHHYVYFGSQSGLENVLPGVKVEVLGPPTVEQSRDVLKERRNDQAEFWMLAAAATRMTTSPDKPLFAGEPFVRGKDAPRWARWFIRHMRGIHARQLFDLVRIVDDALNNTSVILLFTIGKTKLLFPGDAQIENWQYALARPQILRKLQGVNVYKVGHHGSRNATPKTLWRQLKKRRHGLKAVLSTKSGKFPGRKGSGTEVPRETLKKALTRDTKLTNTQTAPCTQKEFWLDLPVPLR
jgi:metallo-beta-lactamase superfamily protein